MAAGLNTAAVQVGSNAIAGVIGALALYSDTPSADGKTNLTTADLEAVTPSSTDGVISVGSTSFTGGAASGAVLYVGYWSGTDTSTDTFYGYDTVPNTDDLTFNAAGEYTVDSVTITGSSSDAS